MKHLKHLFTALLLLCTSVATAHDFEIGGIYYNITDVTSKTVSVTYKGNSYDDYLGEYAGNIVIPENVTFDGVVYRVTSIGKLAFTSCHIIGIQIPNSVTSIGELAFYFCSIPSIEIPDNVTSIEKNAFFYSGLNSVRIGNGVKSIEKYTFYNSRSLTDVIIGDSVVYIGDKAFQCCESLVSIEIPNSVKTIGKEVFSDCVNLEKIELPDSITSLGYNAFAGTAWYNAQPDGEVYAGRFFYKYKGEMSIDTAVEIKEGTLGIVESAFSDCYGLKSIKVPDGVMSVGDYAFKGCTNLKRFDFPNSVVNVGYQVFDGTAWYSNRPEGDIYIGSIYYRYKGEMSADTSIEIKDGTLGIAGGAFEGCSGLVGVVMPNSVTNIEDNAFKASGILTAEIPGSVTFIGDRAFANCVNLESVVIPGSVKNIGIDAFDNCFSLEAVHISDLSAWCKIDFVSNYSEASCNYANPLSFAKNLYLNNELITELVIPEDVTEIKYLAFYGDTAITSVNFHKGLTGIGIEAFYGCDNLKTVINFSSLTIEKECSGYGYAGYYADRIFNAPNGSLEGDFVFGVIDGVNTLMEYWGSDVDIVLPKDYNGECYVIGAEVFKNNSSIISVAIPEGVTGIGNNAFSGCTSLDSIKIPNSVTSVGDYAFAYCYALETVSMGYGIESIGEAAFEDCGSLTSITSLIPAVVLSAPGDYAFSGIDKDSCILYVPNDAGAVYASTAGWSDFDNIVEFGSFYTVMYMVDGSVYKAMSLVCGEVIPIPAAPEKEGHTFSGWSEVPATMPAEDITVTGSFVVNYYTVTYMVDGEVYATDSVAYGDEVVLIDEPVREGYTFSGWSEVPETMPAEDITVTGTFTKTDTGIDEVIGEDGKVKREIHDLQGRKVDEITERGIYVINGNKVLVK